MLLHKPAYLYTMVIKNKAQASPPKFLQDFTAFNPPESVLIKKSPAYILFLLFHHQTMRVFQTPTITTPPKARSSAKFLHSSSEKERLNWKLRCPHQPPCGCYLGCWTFVSHYMAREGRKRGDKNVSNFQSPNRASEGEAREALPSISWEHTTCVFNSIQQLFYARVMLSNSPRCWPPGALFTAIHLHFCPGTTASEQSARGKHRLLSPPPQPDDPIRTPMNSTARLPYRSQEEGRVGYVNTVNNISTTKRRGWMKRYAGLQI